MENLPPTVLVADDESDMRLLVRAALEIKGYEVVEDAVDGADAVNRIRDLDPPPVPAVLILDYRMPHLNGVAAARAIHEQYPDLPVILFSAFLSDEIVAEAQAAGITACIAKGDIDELTRLVADLTAS